jgi:transcriptional regulator GlxA family with amidase domain
LRQTDLGLDTIANQAGCSTTSHFCRLFQTRFNQTPSEYRHACKVRAIR